jgi:hypothetical protein
MVTKRAFFQSQKLVVTVLPPDAPPRICPSDTCCKPQSGGCRISVVCPPIDQLTDADLRSLISDLRSKLNVEEQGIEIILTTRSEQEYSKTHRTLEAVIGAPVPAPKY